MEQELLENLIIDEFTSLCTHHGNPEQTAMAAMRQMKEHNIRHLPIIEDGEIKGIVTDRELNLVINSPENRELKAKEIMIEEPYIVQAGTSLRNVVFEMSRKKIGSAIIENFEGDKIGIFTSIDALNALVELLQK